MDVAAEVIHRDYRNPGGVFDFLSLPLELQLHLLSFLDPLDVIALRKTCKTLRQATLQRQLWLHALRRVCAANSIFAPSFPLMEMSLLELEHAAVVPSLWASVGSASRSLLNGDDQPLVYTTKRILHVPTFHSDDSGTEWGGYFMSLFLVPGGRYLILFFTHRISIYDLGNTPDTLLDHKARLIASVEIQFDGLFLVHPSPDGLALRIFVSIEPTEDEDDLAGLDQSCKYYVYEIYPHHDHPRLEVISQWSPIIQPFTPHLYSIHLNRIVFKFGRILRVWDFVADTSVMWRIVDDFRQIIIADNAIILLGSTGVSVWNIPALVPHGREHVTPPYADIPILNPLFQIDYPESIPPLDDDSMINGVGDWYTEPWCYDILTPGEASFTVSRYLVTFNKDMAGGTIEKTGDFELLTTEIDVTDDGICVEPYRICRDQLVMSWSEDSVIKAYTSTLSSRDSVILRHDKPLVLAEQEGIDDTQISLCPFSSRLCLLSEEDNEVHVYDFRSPLCSKVQSVDLVDTRPFRHLERWR